MNRKILILGIVGLVVLVLGILILVSLGGKQSGPPQKGDVVLQYWGVDDTTEVIDPFIQQFQKTHGGVKVEYKKLERATYDKQVVDALAAGKGPDLFQVHNTWLPRYYDKITAMPEKELPVDDYRQTFFKGIVDETVIDNRIYGVPLYLDTLGLFYNDELFTDSDFGEPPRSWQNLVGNEGTPIAQTQIGQLTQRQGATINRSAIALGKPNVTRSADILSLMMLQNRTDMVNQERDKALYNLPQKVEGKDMFLGTRALELYTCFGDPRCKYYTWDGSQEPIKAFASGKVAMIIGYPYLRQQITKLNPDMRIGIAKVPQVASGDPVNYASFWPHVVSKSSAHQGEAWKFIKFMSEKEQIRGYQEATERVSPRKDVAGSGKGTTFYEQNETATTWYKGDDVRADATLVEMITRVVGGTATPQQAIDAAANAQTGILVDVKQRFGRPS